MQNDASNTKKCKALAIAMVAVSFIGFVDSMYLTANRFFGIPLQCGDTHSCDAVTTSSYAVFLGVPVVLMGVIYYLAIFFGSYLYLEYRSQALFKITAAATVGGAAFSAWLVYVQLGILHAICLYCMVSAGSSFLLFILGLAVLKTFAPSPSPNAIDQE